MSRPARLCPVMSRFSLPTKYDGRQYRSLLEAKWACFFDLCGWSWEYEPHELYYYIPDFVLTAPVRMLVEVKPAHDIAELSLHAGKVGQSGWIGKVSIVGVSPKVILGDLRPPENFEELWDKACNTVQWSPDKLVPRPLVQSEPKPVQLTRLEPPKANNLTCFPPITIKVAPARNSPTKNFGGRLPERF